MRISTSKLEAMALRRKSVECSLRVRDKLMPQVEEFKFLRVLFTSEREGNGRSIEELVLQLQWCGRILWW